MAKKLTQRDVDKAIAASEATVRTRRLLPKLADLKAAFPDGVVEGDPKKRWKFRFPRHADPLKQERVNAQVGDMTDAWRKAEIDRGGNENAERSYVRFKDGTGRERSVLEHQADDLMRRDGTSHRSFGYSPAYSNAMYWRKRQAS